jgi:hypothetical protein
MNPRGPLHVGRLLTLALLGIATGVVGTGAHRAFMPWGVLLALAAVAAASVLARAYAGFPGLVAFGAGWVAVVEVLRGVGPGGDVLVRAQPVGYIWIFGGMVAAAAASFAPKRWFWDHSEGQGAAESLGTVPPAGTVTGARLLHD